jgi:putative membrane protein
MSTPLERLGFARATGRMGWPALVGIILVPLVVAGILIWALWDPGQRLSQVTAAIVNNDVPVTINGQTVPLGRQLAAGLVDGTGSATSSTATAPATTAPATTAPATNSPGTSTSASTSAGGINYTWVITDKDDAAVGLASGRYAALITIPAGFSAAATSFSGPAADAKQATIDVTTSDTSTVVDNAISQTISTTAAALAGRQLTTTYLENVYTSFNTLGTQLGQAASGADSLASGTASLASGSAQLSGGAAQLAAGASSLSSGTAQLSQGLDQLSDGLGTLQQQTESLPAQTSQLASGAQGLANALHAVNTALAQKIAALTTQVAVLTAEVQSICAPGHLPNACDSAEATLASATTNLTSLSAVAALAPLASSADQVAAGASHLSAGMPAVTAGISQSASAAHTLAAAGTSVDSGAAALAASASSLATGAQSVADGAANANSGASSLAAGLDSSVKQVPSYTESESSHLAGVVADPVVVGSTTGLGVGTTSVPFYAVLALWLGGLASLIVLRAAPARAFGSTKPSFVLALRAFLPAALVGAVQGLVVTAILSTVVSQSFSGWLAFAGFAVLIGVAFAAVNQALVALFGGAGRFLSMIVALVLIGTSIIATAPSALFALSALLPVQPALDGFHAVLNGGNGGGSIVGLVVWTLGSLVVTTLAIARKRSVPARTLVPSITRVGEPA